ncbi:TetR/AcrR family transcriptional regulator [Pseudomonadota bacterium]|uniref:TetR/AcrR family transcriptional regulator n=1 Tax=Shewanella sp. 10N.286.51.B2 TaxID=3229707 RepID=UPI003551A9E3
MLKDQIAASLEQAFSNYGFAEPSVTQLKVACGVSLRTLYKHYPSKEEMIVGALQHRHQRYLKFLSEHSPEAGLGSIQHIFTMLGIWMAENAPNGCMSLNALAAFPENELISSAVTNHKKEVMLFLGGQSLREDLALPLYLLHEGVSSAWPIIGNDAIQSAQHTILALLSENKV